MTIECSHRKQLKSLNSAGRFDLFLQISSADDDIADILEKQKYRFDDQFLFMFSDHGHRFDAVRETFVGRLEERLPFFSVHVPRSLRTQYPHFDKVLRWNAKVC